MDFDAGQCSVRCVTAQWEVQQQQQQEQQLQSVAYARLLIIQFKYGGGVAVGAPPPIKEKKWQTRVSPRAPTDVTIFLLR